MNDTLRRPADLRVAVVDDEPFIRDLLLRILRKSGVASATGYGDAPSALREACAGSDVILCDLNMPGMDGVTFLRHLSESGYKGSVILLSGEDERLLHAAEELALAHHLHVLGSLHKPVSPATLEPLLQRALKLPPPPVEPRHEQAPVRREELAAAIDSGAIDVWFQPKVCARTGQLAGAEALARWRHAVYGMIPPNTFITLAEESDLIDPLTDLVLKKSLHHAGRWNSVRPGLGFAVNIAVDTLSRLDLPETIGAAAEAAGFPTCHLVLEVTESRRLRDVRAALETLSRLRLKGVGLSIDDFGTGHSSLDQLRRIPFTEMKIDRAFIHGAAADPTARIIFEAGVTLGKRLGMRVVAEGVESPDDLSVAVAAGVDVIQGFIVSRPVPPEEFEAGFIRRSGTLLP